MVRCEMHTPPAALRGRTIHRALVVGGIVAGVLSASSRASADVQACLSASEKGQRARSAGRLREARDHFVVCGAESCPGLVRRDCAQWTSELSSTLPTVVFGARDKQGRDLFDVKVTMDGELLVEKLDGKSVTVDPGKHTFRFDAPGYPAVSEVALIKEGERARVFNVTFDPGGEGRTTSPASSRASSEDSLSDEAGGHTVVPWIVVGAGVVAVAVGAAVVLTTPDRPSNCNEITQKCTRLGDQTEEDFRKDQERAGTADSQPVLGFAVAGAGLALVAGGLLWHFLEPTTQRSTALRLAPWTTGKSSGLSLGASFE